MKDTVQADDITLMGNERFAFASGKLLKYDGTSLEGKNDYNTNKVIFHYGKVEKEFGPIANEKMKNWECTSSISILNRKQKPFLKT